MNKITMIFIIGLLSMLMVGCGGDKKPYSGVDNNGNKYVDNTKVKTIADSYDKYSKLKTEAYEMLNNSSEYSANYNLSLGLLGFVTVDLSLIPITFCGLENAAAVSALEFFYQDIDYKTTKDSCDLTFKTENGEDMTYNTKFDEKTDSVQTKIYLNGKLQYISEYIKLNTGYATQFYSVNDDQTSTYKSIFDSEKIVVGMQSNTSEPESLFKNAAIATEEWTKSQELWSKYENNKVTSIYDGKTVN